MAVQQAKAVQVSHLVKRYPNAKNNAVDDISFEVEHGEIFGLLGPNGAGKSTTIGVLTTMIVPTSGIIRIMDVDVVAHPTWTKQRIAVVPQRMNLDRSLNAREILTFHAGYHGVSRVQREARADMLLEDFGLANRAQDMVTRFSGGMAQRLMLARAMMHRPDVLFLDEPTNNLDPQTRLFLWERIRMLRNQGVTIIVTTHDMLEADHLCDRIAIVDRGKLLALDTPSELKKRVPFSTMLELRVRVPALVPHGECQEPAESPDGDALLQALSALPTATRVERVHLPPGEEQADIHTYHLLTSNARQLTTSTAQVVEKAGLELRDVHLMRPTLEDVFIHITGRELR